MKTKITYIAILSLLFTFSNTFAQEAEGLSTSASSSYLAKKKLDTERKMEAPVNQEQTRKTIQATTPTRLAAAELINYQAVARDAGGNLMTNAAVTIDFEIRDGAGGTAVFNETQNLNTDANGVFSAQIGSVASLAGVNWLAITPWLDVTMDGTNVGETAMASVPTALHSKQSGTVMIHGSGAGNPDKMIAQHSPAFPGWGIGYADVGDDVDFMAGGAKNLSIDLGTGNLTTQGNLEVNETTTSPALNRIYGNSMPIAFGSVTASGAVATGYGITGITNPATGLYEITLDHNTNVANSIIVVTPFTGSFGAPEICGYNPTAANVVEVRIQTIGGVATDSAFAFVVYGNQ